MLFSTKTASSLTARKSYRKNRLEVLESREMFSVSQLLPGDADCNGAVEFADFLALSRNYGVEEADWSHGDFDGDGSVGFPDFLTLSEHFGQSNPSHAPDTLANNENTIRFDPVANEGPDINPLKGFNSGWWRDEDHASVGFQYIEWGLLEPEDDAFDWNAVEEILDRPGSDGRHLIIQFVVDWDWRTPVDANYLGPDWLLERVGENRGNADPDDPNSRAMRATDYNDPVFIEEATEAIEALTGYFRDDPRNFVLQTGVLGFWGEWHTFPRNDWAPTDATKEAILDAYMSNIGPDGFTQVRYPDDPINVPQRGMGYTNGSAVLTDHGTSDFGKPIAENNLWKNGPVGGEWPPGIDETEIWENFFQGNEGAEFLHQGHYSTMLPPEGKDIAQFIPDWEPDETFMSMHRQMGYNFQAQTVRHLHTAELQQTQIEVDLVNSGIAPFYKNWDVQIAILDGETNEVIELIETDTDIRTLGPGESTTVAVSSNVTLDDDRQYQIGLRIVQPGADDTKAEVWDLNARNTYVVLANEVEVVEGVWSGNNALVGGWNVLGTIER